MFWLIARHPDPASTFCNRSNSYRRGIILLLELPIIIIIVFIEFLSNTSRVSSKEMTANFLTLSPPPVFLLILVNLSSSLLESFLFSVLQILLLISSRLRPVTRGGGGGGSCLESGGGTSKNCTIKLFHVIFTRLDDFLKSSTLIFGASVSWSDSISISNGNLSRKILISRLPRNKMQTVKHCWILRSDNSCRIYFLACLIFPTLCKYVTIVE